MSSSLYENLPEEINKNKNNLPDDFSDLVYCVAYHELFRVFENILNPNIIIS